MRLLAQFGFALGLISVPSSAEACRQLAPFAKLESSHLAVDGIANCLKGSNQCTLQINSVIKGDRSLTGKAIQISVDVRPPIRRDGNKIILGRCPQTFEPWKSMTTGRFYLVKTKDDLYDAAYPPDVSDEELFDDEFEELND